MRRSSTIGFDFSVGIGWLRALEHLEQCMLDLLEHASQIGRQRRAELKRLTCSWLFECEALCVKKRAFQTLHRTQIVRNAAVNSAVQRVADDWMPNCAEVYADLMCSAGRYRHAKERRSRNMARPRDPRGGGARVSRAG